jgi:hypothetical protein
MRELVVLVDLEANALVRNERITISKDNRGEAKSSTNGFYRL